MLLTVKVKEDSPLKTVLIPKIGTALGNGSWDDVSNIIDEILVKKHRIKVIIFEL